MKTMRKIASLLLALVMIFGLATTAFAQTVGTETAGTGSITISNATKGVTYKVVKIFDATVTDTVGGPITYVGTIPEGLKTVFTTDNNGNIKRIDGKNDEDVINTVTAWAKSQTETASVASDGSELSFVGLDYGYYAVVSSQGALVTIDSTNPNATVTDKNSVPSLDKKITNANSIDDAGKNALAQIGTDVEYTVTITVGNGASNYVFHDKMGTGLTFKGNNSVTITGVNADQYEILTPTDGHTLDIKFDDGIAAGTTITIKYLATINESALSSDPKNNTAYLSYGDNHETIVQHTHVYNAKYTVTKQDGQNKPLAGAGFVIKNAEGKYYKLVDNVVTWVASIDEADEHMSNADGSVPDFIGLANGTYTLVEKTVPAGYNKAADSTFTIAAGDYTATNLEQTATVTNNAGTELPTTGGMGTTLLYALGGILVLAAVILLVTKKRMASN